MDHVPGSESASAPAWHAMPCPQVIDRLQSDGDRGLGQAAAAARLAAGGRNRLPTPQPDAAVVVLLRQLRSPLVYVLLLAAGLALLLGHVTDAGFIGVVLLVNSLLGAWQELQAERQSASLQGLLRVRATVQRDGIARQVDAEELVDGDVVLLESGDRVPADLRLLDARGLEVDAALLTGESLPVLCDAAALCGADVAAPDRINCVHAGTLVVRGRARGIVIATGLQTEVGRLARAMVATVAGKPPLTARMERFSRVIAWVVLAAAVLIGAIAVLLHHQPVFTMFSFGVALAVSAIPEGLPVAVTVALAIAARRMAQRGAIAVLLHHQPVFTMFTFGVALAVSAIPEGLPVAVTVALAIAARRMAQRGAIVRQLPAVEGLGSCSLIASDKTGTLTCNELTAVELVLDDGSRWSASGAGYAPAGEVRVTDGAGVDSAERLQQVLRIAAACNEAEIFRHDGHWEYRGDPTDLALLALARKGGVDRSALLDEWPCIDRLAYEPERRYAATFHHGAGGSWIAVKGAPERVFELCELDVALRTTMQREVMALAAAGKRVLALAEGHAGIERAPDGGPEEPSGLILRGVVGLVDPLRPGAAEAVARCRAAGIRVAMITGDHPVTALAIARDLGIAQTADEVVAGPALAGLPASGLREIVERATVFARVTPEQKLAIVSAAQSAGHFVAVTGDGVNDAPALRCANIGVAMGRGGTDVAREAADLVLSDDNFATIVAGVEEGRIAYRNIRSVVYLLTAAGIAEVLTVGIAVLAGLPLPLLPVQLLWLNLVTNGIQDVGLAFERGTGDELQSPPRSSREPVFDRLMLQRGVLAGLWMALLGLALFITLLNAGRPLEEARNALLLLMVLMQNVDAVNARSEIAPVLRLPWRNNPLLLAGIGLALALHVAALHLPVLQPVLAVMPPTPADWVILPGLALSLLALMEGQKYWRRRQGNL